MHEGLVQLLKRLRLSSFGKRRSNIGGAGGGAEHQVVGESSADMLTMGDGVCFSHLMRGCRSTMASLVEADLLSSVF